MNKLKLYGAKAFNPALKGVIRDMRPSWLLEEMDLAYDHITFDPQKGENKSAAYLKINPFAKVPTLEDGDFAIFESAAICQYLAEKNERFIPEKGTPDYFICLQWSYFSVTNIETHCARIFGCDYFMEKNETTKTIRKMAVEALERFLPTLEDTFAKQETLMASGFNMADVLLASTLYFNHKSEILDAYPHTTAYLKRMTSRPAFLRALARNGE